MNLQGDWVRELRKGAITMIPGYSVVRRSGLAALLMIAITLAAGGLFTRLDSVRGQEQASTVPPGSEPVTPLQVIGRVPLPGEVFSGRLTLFLDENLTPPADENGQPVCPLLFAPPIQGTWQILGNCIDFKAEAEPQSNIIYDVRLLPSLTSVNGRGLAPDAAAISLATFQFLPQRVWTVNKTAGENELALSFSAPPDAAALQERIQAVDSAGATVAVRVSPVQDAQSTIVHLSLAANVAMPVTFSIPAGLPDASHRIQTTVDSSLKFPDDAKLKFFRLGWNNAGDEGKRIELQFSHNIAPADLQNRLTITDSATGENLAYTVASENASNNVVVELDEPLTEEKTLVLSIEPGLTSVDLARLDEPVSQQLIYKRQALSIEYAWWDRRGKDGTWLQFRMNESVSLDSMKQHLSFEPAVQIGEVRYEGWGEFHVSAPWQPEEVYTIVLSPGLTDDSGRFSNVDTLRYDLEPVPEVKGAGFPFPGKYYFPRRGGTQFALESRNLDKVEILVSRLFPSNIAVALESMDSDEGSWEFDERWGEELKTTSVKVANKPNELVHTPVDLKDIFAENWRGVFRLRTSEYGDGKLIVWTDIGVLAHWQADEVAVFAHDLTTLEPVPMAKVTVYSRKNQVLGTANTDANGIAQLKALNKALGVPLVVVVETESDYTFLELERRGDDPVAYTDAMPAFDRDGYDAFIYADRDLYRPGEMVHLRWIARTNYGDALANVPLKLTVTRPNGSVMISQAVTLSTLGTGAQDLATDKTDPTGRYTATLTAPGNGAAAGSYAFSLEEFVPNRIAVSVSQDAPILVPGTAYPVLVNAMHLFGAPAADRKCEAEVALLKGAFKSDRWKEFNFSNSDEYEGELVSIGTAQTDAQGNATFEYNPQLPGNATSPLSAIIRGRVFELGGRAVTSTKTATVFPGDVCLGITAAAAADGQGVETFVAAIRPDETPASLASVKVTLEREEWSYYVREYDSYNDWRWTKVFKEIESRDVPLADGRGTTLFPVHGYGYYRIKVSSDATPQYSTVQFYTYWDGRVEKVDEARPSLVKISLNKPEYTVGEEVEARVESPFDGAGIVVVQGEGIRRVLPVTVSGGLATVRFAVDAEDVPNVWMEVTVAHKASENSDHVYPYASFAMANIPVRNPRRALQVSFPDLPSETRPAQDWPLTVEIRNSEGSPVTSELTLAAVDEGIHALSSYKTPDPYGWLMRLRRPDFNRAHFYDLVAYDFGKTPIGGDGMASRVGRDAPFVGDNWIKPVALWSGVVTTDASGRATVTLSLPEFSGQLRLVAVACTDVALGAGEGKVFVRRPFMLRTSMPRFALPGDRFQARVAVFNTTAEPRSARIAWTGSGTLQGEGGQEVALPPSSEGAATAEFTASPVIGQGEIVWKAEILDAGGAVIDSLTETAPIPVRPPAQYQTNHELVVLNPGESRTFTNSRYLEAENTTMEISVSTNPAHRLQEALRYLVAYPYGCIEQTTSRCMPMYLLRRSEKLVDASLVREKNVSYYLQQGIDRLFSMQTSSGGLGYWPGDQSPNAYGSVYACHFLTLVRRDGELRVPETAFKALQKFVREIATDWTNDSDYFQDYRSESSLYLRAYAYYVLALDGDLDAIRQIGRFDNLTLPTAARYLLAAALAMNTQDTDRVKLYMSTAPTTADDVREQDATFNSEIRNKAVQLLASLQINTDEKLCHELALQLTRFLENNRYGTTQETAFICTALGEYFGRFAPDPSAFSAAINGPEGEKVIKGGEVYQYKRQGPGTSFTVTNTGSGGGHVFVNLTTGGTPAQLDLQAVSNGLAVTRRMLTLQGEEVQGTAYAHGASYVVDFTIKTTDTVKNVIVDDTLPAGFEIENPRLDPTVMAGVEMPETAAPSYLEVRDDRLVAAFNALGPGDHHFCYVVRAVTAGTFQRPGLRAESMYEPEIRGTTAPETVQVQ